MPLIIPWMVCFQASIVWFCYKESGAIKMEKKEKVKDFNHHFTTVLNKFTIETAPLESLAIEYYTSIVIPSIRMLDK
jgi:hypothetical protein